MMVWYEAAYVWLLNNYVVVGVALVVLVLIIANEIGRRKKANTQTEQKKPEYDPFPSSQKDQYVMPELDDIDLMKDLTETEFMGRNSYERLQAEQKTLRKEITEKKQKYNDAREKREKYLIIMKRIYAHLPELIRQDRMLTEELKRLDKNGREN